MIYFKQNKFMKTEEKEREGKRIPDQNLSVQSVKIGRASCRERV